jgi:subtilisin family serine protease
MLKSKLAFTVVAVFLGAFVVAAETPDPNRDILVTFDNDSARSANGGLAAPYQRRKRYSISATVRRDASALADEYSLQEIEHWPIRSLSVYCFVYRVPEGADRNSVIEDLNADSRVESAQPLQSFETSANRVGPYDDEYANLQYGLDILDIAAAHEMSKGAGIRIAIIDSDADRTHEDLKGRIQRVKVFSNEGESADQIHGTAVASVIGARSNNTLGIVGIAPQATLELYVSCWSGGATRPATCDSFSLSKALDSMLEDPPHVLNLSLNGPHDPLLERLIQKATQVGVVVVAAAPSDDEPQKGFPSNMPQVIGVSTAPTDSSLENTSSTMIFAPGNRILVAVPTDQYDFRSGSSLAAAHVSGVVALLLAATPNQTSPMIHSILQRSQAAAGGAMVSINACNALNLATSTSRCRTELHSSERDLNLEYHSGLRPVRGADNRNPFVGIVNP